MSANWISRQKIYLEVRLFTMGEFLNWCPCGSSPQYNEISTPISSTKSVTAVSRARKVSILARALPWMLPVLLTWFKNYVNKKNGAGAKEFTSCETWVGEELIPMLRGDTCCFTGSFLCSITWQHWIVGENWEGKKGKRKVHPSFNLVLNQHRFQLKLSNFLLF